MVRAHHMPPKLLTPCCKGRDMRQDRELAWEGVAPSRGWQLGCCRLRGVGAGSEVATQAATKPIFPAWTFSVPVRCELALGRVGRGVWERTIPVHK